MTAEQIALDFDAAQQTELPFIEELFGRKELQQQSLLHRSGIKSKKLLTMLQEGCHCPLCGQWMKKYARTINREMAIILVLTSWHFRRYPQSAPLHIDRWLDKMWGNGRGMLKVRMKGREHGRLVMWGLLEHCPSRESKSEDRVVIGNYRITPKGVEFADGRSTVPKYAFVYDHKVLGFSDEQVNIKQCLVKEHSMAEILNTPQPEFAGAF
jgi:hypothetical protein